MRIYTRSFPGAATLHLALMMGAFALDIEPRGLFAFMAGGTALSLLIWAPGGIPSSTLTLEGHLIVGEGLFGRRIIALSNLAAIEVIGEVLLRRVRIYARDGSTVIEADLRFGQCEELLRVLAARAPKRIEAPQRPREAYAGDVLSILVAAALVGAVGWPIHPIGFAVGILIASVWTVVGWSRLRDVRAWMASGRIPPTLTDWADAIGVAHESPSKAG